MPHLSRAHSLCRGDTSSEEGPAKGIEVSVLTESELREGAHPYVTECHYLLFWDEYVREAGWENWNQELRRDM